MEISEIMEYFNRAILLFILFTLDCINAADKPCVAQQIAGQSAVCVCNATYCDEITREPPAPGGYVAYITSKAGSRFKKVKGELQTNITGCCTTIISINPKIKYQTVEGFGGAVTDAAGINWKNLSDTNLQQNLINSYFGDNGLQYNMLRVPIGGTDFSTRPYAYNELPEDDKTLSNFTLAYEDIEYKIPMIKAIMKTSSTPIHIVSTTWSPPPWMKTNDKFSGISRLKSEYFQTYADYHYKFLEKYAEAGIPIWGITTTNEPINGVLSLASFNSLGWTAGSMGQWIVNNLGPTIRNSTFKDLKIIAVDDQRITIPLWFNAMIEEHPESLRYIDGVGVHYYTDMIVPASVLGFITERHADKFILATEACEGSFPWQKEKVLLGSWTRARNYIIDIITDLNHNLVGWIDWNLCLNAQGGPNWAKNFVDSAIIVLPQKKEFVKQPMFYAMGHFSKFIPRGSQRIKSRVKGRFPFHLSGVENVAFLTPYNTIVLVIYNEGKAKNITVELEDEKALVALETKSVITVEIPYEK